jgi:uncharacterized protein
MNHINRLQHETSPYLLQHAHNPVDWYPWCEEAFDKAKKEEKLIIVSIGYSACHWCHVMEKEVFEKNEAAEFMNRHFVNIKVDREERPDIDQVYMESAHLMGQQGGWPLNVVTLPDGKPIFAGTYFPLQKWLSVLEQLVEIYRDGSGRMEEYAMQVQHALRQMDRWSANSNQKLPLASQIDEWGNQWSSVWDHEEGGTRRAPKFPMPSNFHFLFHYGALTKNKNALDHAHFTLKKMAFGGIYDQIGGGFCRYSVDGVWKVPHFEKMLYDNGQLLSLYALAYSHNKDQEYEKIIRQTVAFLERELKSPEGLYFAALDADSEGVEGKYYTWTEHELRELLGDDYELAARYYNINALGYWEHNQYIPLRSTEQSFGDEEIEKIKTIESRLLGVREKRIHPGLDYKCIASWNALALSGLCHSFAALNDLHYLERANELASQFTHYFMHTAEARAQLIHSFARDKKQEQGFLEDYALSIQAFIDLYEVGGEEKWLHQAAALMQTVELDFSDTESNLYWFTNSQQTDLFHRKKEWQGKVIPSSNSVMSKNLFRLGHHFAQDQWIEKSAQMLSTIADTIDYVGGFSNWLEVALLHAYPYKEIVITGPTAHDLLKERYSYFLPNTLTAASTMNSSLPLFEGRNGMKVAVYVCTDRTCAAPVGSITEAVRPFL